MATIKSYTDIEQSKKLAEILPLESADAFYPWRELMKDYDSIYVPEEMSISDLEEYDVCAWSLAALLDVLPTIDDGFEPQLHRSLDKYRCTYEGEEDSSGLWRVADNPVDACVAMIEKLHELNLL